MSGTPAPEPPRCRICDRPLERVFVDLGVSPLANALVEPEDLSGREDVYPLKTFVCEGCLLVQLPPAASPETLFGDYSYFSSFSDTWLAHCRDFAGRMVAERGLGAGSRVVEVASNDGYLLRFFRDLGVPVLGIEPAANVARAALDAGIPTRVEFFGEDTARRLVAEGTRADLLVGNNVLAHVPDLHDFVAGLEALLAPGGVLTLEFPHLLRLIDENQFDTIYHEHFSYFSLATSSRALADHGLAVFEVDELPTHGGSLRLHATRASEGPEIGASVAAVLEAERAAGLDTLEGHLGFPERVRATKRRLLEFLRGLKADGASIAGYGAPAKGNTLLNTCGIGTDLVDYTVDRSPHKQGRYLPGSRIPIHPVERIFETRPDYLFVLPWNLADEIAEQMAGVRDWGGRLFVAIPEVRLLG